MRRFSNKNIAQLVGILIIGAGLKYFYSSASVNDLRWILRPTTFLVELVTGERFVFESYAGYMNADHTFIIAASCSGVNFFLTAFLMLSLKRLWNRRHDTAGWALIPVSLLLAYLTTIIANTVRIAIALQLHRMDQPMTYFDPEQLHRLEGIFIYFGFLILLFIVSERFEDTSSPPTSYPRRIVLPLAIYWVTTLGIPIANGAYRQGLPFWEHSAFVLITPLVLILPLAVLHKIAHERHERHERH